MQKLTDRAIVKITGSDAKRYLQSIISNDIEILDKGVEDNVADDSSARSSIYAYFLNAQGKFLYEAFITKDNGGYLLDVNKEHRDALVTRLDFYKLNMDADISSLDELEVIYSRSPIDAVICMKDPRYSKLGYRIIAPRDAVVAAIETSLDERYFEDKYEFAIPDGFVDLVPAKSLPPEFACDFLNSVSYIKGCYTGQEVISRTKYQGVIRKRLYRVTFEDCFDENLGEDLSGQEITQDINQDSVKIGVITSNWKNKAIALVRYENIAQDVSQFKANVGGRICRLELAPFYPEFL